MTTSSSPELLVTPVDALQQADLFIPPEQSARAAGLRYVSDQQPGIHRKRWGRGFSYFLPTGDRLQDPAELERLKALPIPPAWEDVWICADPRGHLLATGRDAKGRKQYRYHPKWRDVRNQHKFDRLIPFGYARPHIRAVVDRHLRQHQLTKEKILAVVIYLLEATLIRVGNEAYRQQNDSFGLTTLRDRHLELSGSKLNFHFVGKSGVEHEVTLSDRRLARAVRRCQELPGQELFQYVDEAGVVHSLDSADVNDYLQHITQTDFTSKDFRTWAGTVCTAATLNELGPATTKQQVQSHLRTAVEAASQLLGNRFATCKNYYVHPMIAQAYEDGWLLAVWQRAQLEEDSEQEPPLSPSERSLIATLRHGLEVQTDD